MRNGRPFLEENSFCFVISQVAKALTSCVFFSFLLAGALTISRVANSFYYPGVDSSQFSLASHNSSKDMPWSIAWRGWQRERGLSSKVWQCGVFDVVSLLLWRLLPNPEKRYIQFSHDSSIIRLGVKGKM